MQRPWQIATGNAEAAMVEILGLPQVEPLRGGNSSGGNSNRKAFPKQTTMAAASKFANAPQLSLGHPAKNTQNTREATHKVKRVQKPPPSSANLM